jgi:hypothetical protein
LALTFNGQLPLSSCEPLVPRLVCRSLVKKEILFELRREVSPKHSELVEMS